MKLLFTQEITSFDSDGFSLGTGTGNYTNIDNNSYVAWCFKGGGTSAPNTNGSIATDVSANVNAGFSIGTYTGNNTAGATIGHGLNSTPELVIVKLRSGLSPKAWTVYAEPLGNTKYLYLNSNIGEGTYNFWNNTSPTSSVISLSGDTNVNSSSGNYVFYAFHSVAGYQKIGTYTGDGNASGPIVNTGFEPAFLLIKQTNTSGNNWVVYDNKRDPVNARYRYLSPNTTDAEGSNNASNYPIVDFLSNGFQIAGTDGRVNASGGTLLIFSNSI